MLKSTTCEKHTKKSLNLFLYVKVSTLVYKTSNFVCFFNLWLVYSLKLFKLIWYMSYFREGFNATIKSNFFIKKNQNVCRAHKSRDSICKNKSGDFSVYFYKVRDFILAKLCWRTVSGKIRKYIGLFMILTHKIMYRYRSRSKQMYCYRIL